MTERLVGVDYGKKRVGLAISDPLCMFAIPVGTFTPRDVFAKINHIAQNEGIKSFIIGWPLTLDGEEEEATLPVQHFINRLTKLYPNIPIIKVDERYSSKRAVEALVGAHIKKKARRQKGRVDSAAAAIILQDYLEEDK